MTSRALHGHLRPQALETDPRPLRSRIDPDGSRSPVGPCPLGGPGGQPALQTPAPQGGTGNRISGSIWRCTSPPLPASGVPHAPRGAGLTFAKPRHRAREVKSEAPGPGRQAGDASPPEARRRRGGAGRPARLRGAGSARAPPHWACSDPGQRSRIQPHPAALGPAPAPRPRFLHFLAPPPLGPAHALQLPRSGRASAKSRPRPPWVRPPSVPAPPPRPGHARAAHAPKTLGIPALSAPLGQRPGQRGECLGCCPPAKVGPFLGLAVVWNLWFYGHLPSP